MTKISKEKLDEKVKSFHKLVKRKNAIPEIEVIGNCMFTGEPILTEDLKKDPSPVGVLEQLVNVFVPGTDDSIVMRPNYLFYTKKSLVEVPFRAVVLKQLGKININYMEIQDSYLKFKKKEALQKKHKLALEEELKQLDEPDEKEETKGETKEDVGND